MAHRMAWGLGQKWPPAIVPVVGLVLLLGPALILAGEPVGGVSGHIVLEGDFPGPARLPVKKHRNMCGESKPSEEFVVSPDRGLANVVVTVEGLAGPYREPRGFAVLDNLECVFVPHVQVARLGEVLEIRNSDRVIHTAHAYDETKGTLFNVALPVYKRSVRRTLTRAGLFRIACDVGHTWMTAYVMVVGHPYAAVTDSSGAFRIPDVPAGTYSLRFWHERLGIREDRVIIRAGDEAVVNLTWRTEGSRSSLTNPEAWGR